VERRVDDSPNRRSHSVSVCSVSRQPASAVESQRTVICKGNTRRDCSRKTTRGARHCSVTSKRAQRGSSDSAGCRPVARQQRQRKKMLRIGCAEHRPMLCTRRIDEAPREQQEGQAVRRDDARGKKDARRFVVGSEVGSVRGVVSFRRRRRVDPCGRCPTLISVVDGSIAARSSSESSWLSALAGFDVLAEDERLFIVGRFVPPRRPGTIGRSAGSTGEREQTAGKGRRGYRRPGAVRRRPAECITTLLEDGCSAGERKARRARGDAALNFSVATRAPSALPLRRLFIGNASAT
jgi:hypothetical protein